LPGRLNEAHEEMRHIALKMARHLPIHVTVWPLAYRVQKTGGYCWPTPFKVRRVLFLGGISAAFLPSKKASWAHQFSYLRVGQQYPGVFQSRMYIEMVSVCPTLSLLLFPCAGKSPPVPQYIGTAHQRRQPVPTPTVLPAGDVRGWPDL
jgi:hypothetical protein